MSKYDEMCAAAESARNKWFEQRHRCWRCLNLLMGGLEDYCGIPADRITYLHWNGLNGEERNYSRPEGGRSFTLPGATDFDEEDGFWHLGVHIALRPPGHLPPTAVAFVLCVKDQAGQSMLKIGIDGKVGQVDPTDRTQVNAFCDRIFENVKQSFREPNSPKRKSLGFTFERGDHAEEVERLPDD
ncbi:MAG: hypothetical protein ACLQG3_12955 [Terracidiphilus sp.]